MKLLCFLTLILTFSRSYGQSDTISRLQKEAVRLELEITAKTDSLTAIKDRLKAQQVILQLERDSLIGNHSHSLKIPATIRRNTEVKLKADPYAASLWSVVSGEKVTLISYSKGFWLVQKGKQTGYLHKLFIAESPEIEEVERKMDDSLSTDYNIDASSTSYISDKKTTYRSFRKTKPTRVIYTGPRGGRYYINSKGNKTYIRRK